MQGRKVASVSDILMSDSELIEPLKSELDYQTGRDKTVGKTGAAGQAITIMGDKEIPYRLLKKSW